MARVTRVKAARKPVGSCGVCQKQILKGDSYLWWAFYRSPKKIRCTDHPPKPSETTGSETEQMMLAIQEEFETTEVPTNEEDLETIQSDISEAIQEILDLIEEKMSNIEDGFGHIELEAYYAQEEKHEAFESWQSEIDNFDTSAYEEEGEACEKCGLSEDDGSHDDPKSQDDFHDFDPEDEFDGESAMEDLAGLVNEGAGL